MHAKKTNIYSVNNPECFEMIPQYFSSDIVENHLQNLQDNRSFGIPNNDFTWSHVNVKCILVEFKICFEIKIEKIYISS